jgi:hypothetical protein
MSERLAALPMLNRGELRELQAALSCRRSELHNIAKRSTATDEAIRLALAIDQSLSTAVAEALYRVDR